MSLNYDHFKISSETFLNDLNDIADDNAVGNYYTMVSGYQSSGIDIGESLIEKTCTIEAAPSYNNEYTSNQIIKNTGHTNVSSSKSINNYTTIVGEQLTAISANGQYRLGIKKPSLSGLGSGQMRISSDFGVNWNTIDSNTYAGFRCVAMSANGLRAITGTAVSLDGTIHDNYHKMYYNHNGDWSDINKYSTTTIWNASTMNGTDNLKYDTSDNIILLHGFRHVVLSASGKYGACTFSSILNQHGFVYCTSDYGVTWDQVTDYFGPLVLWMSSSGQYCYGVKFSKLWRSSTYGETWEEAPGSLDCNRVTASADGQYVIRYTIPNTADYVTYEIHRSDDYGMTWTTVTNLADENRPISKISMSANGRYVVGESLTRLIRSYNYGASWINDSTYSHTTSQGYGSCSMSADGNHVINLIQHAISSLGSYNNYTSILGYTDNSTATETKDLVEIYESKLKHSSVTDKGSGNFWSIGVSGNGEYILYGSHSQSEPPIQLSTDRGNTWSSVANLNTYTVYGSISISYDGKYLLTGLSYNNAACGLSKDYGSTWEIYNYATTYNNATNMGNVVGMSSDGKYMYTGKFNGANSVGEFLIQRSDDYGENWSAVASLTKPDGQLFNPTQIAISATGQYGIVVGKGCDIYKTSDYGVNWSPCGIGVKFRNTAAISKNGEYCVASEGSATNNVPCGIIYSSDYGANWSSSSITTNATFFAMSMSDSGQYVVANDDYRGLYISRDFGASFDKVTNDSGSFRKCAMTGKGDVIWTVSTSKIQKHNMQ